MKLHKTITSSIVDDTGWKEVRVTSLVADYQRVIKFNRELTAEEMNDVVTCVRLEMYPGWIACPAVTAVRDSRKTGAWVFETTLDSSG